MNNDNEPPSLMQFWSQADEKLVINKSWPNLAQPHSVYGIDHVYNNESDLSCVNDITVIL